MNSFTKMADWNMSCSEIEAIAVLMEWIDEKRKVYGEVKKKKLAAMGGIVNAIGRPEFKEPTKKVKKGNCKTPEELLAEYTKSIEEYLSEEEKCYLEDKILIKVKPEFKYDLKLRINLDKFVKFVPFE